MWCKKAKLRSPAAILSPFTSLCVTLHDSISVLDIQHKHISEDPTASPEFPKRVNNKWQP